jgi:aspartate kinase
VQAKSAVPLRVKAIAVKQGIVVLEARAARSLQRTGLARKIFGLLEQHGCTPDVASLSDTSVTVAIDRKELVTFLKEALPDVEVRAENSKALVSLVGEGIREIPTLAVQVFSALAGLDVRLVSQGASPWSFTVVVKEKDVAEAVQRLHQQLLESPELPRPHASRFERAVAF